MAVLIQMNMVSGVKVRIDKPYFTIGRGEENDLCINDELASRLHAVVEMSDATEAAPASWQLRDMNSTNGTYIKDQRITCHTLTDGEVMRIGKIFLKFHSQDHADLGETRVINKTIIPGLYYISDKPS